MTAVLDYRENATAGDVLAFIAAAFHAGNAAAVSAGLLPVFTHEARLKPDRKGFFVFTVPGAAADRCSWRERLTASLGLVLALPVLIPIAVLVWIAQGRPVFFRQERYGCDGRPFTVFKFRTMVRRSEDLHARLERKLGQEDRLFKLDRDPRVTRAGGFLRRTFLDELPQLLNVARGDMCFVGPRPLPASDQNHYTHPCHRLRLCGMPGMTGLWQVSGRNERTFDEMCLLDCYYLCHRSVRLDAWLIARTLGLLFHEIRLARKPQSRRQNPAGV